jgi:hypothetical protein
MSCRNEQIREWLRFALYRRVTCGVWMAMSRSPRTARWSGARDAQLMEYEQSFVDAADTLLLGRKKVQRFFEVLAASQSSFGCVLATRASLGHREL